MSRCKNVEEILNGYIIEGVSISQKAQLTGQTARK